MLEIGQLVYSKRGRDRGALFVVVALDGQYAYLCDGNTRTFDRPKKKKHKHIQITNEVSFELKKKLDEKSYLNDADFRKALSKHADTACNDSKEVGYLV